MNKIILFLTLIFTLPANGLYLNTGLNNWPILKQRTCNSRPQTFIPKKSPLTVVNFDALLPKNKIHLNNSSQKLSELFCKNIIRLPMDSISPMIIAKDMKEHPELYAPITISPTIVHYKVNGQFNADGKFVNDCGANAVKNGHCLQTGNYKGLNVKDLKTDENSPLKNISGIDALNLENLDELEMQALAEGLFWNKNEYIIISNPSELNLETIAVTDDNQFMGMCQSILNVQRKVSSKYTFILGNMHHHQRAAHEKIGDNAGSYGHWVSITVKVNNEGEVIFGCTNSTGQVCRETRNQLIKLLCKNPYDMHMERLFSSLIPDEEKYNAMKQPVEPTLDNFKEILERAHRNGYTKKPQLKNYLAKMLSLLDCMTRLSKPSNHASFNKTTGIKYYLSKLIALFFGSTAAETTTSPLLPQHVQDIKYIHSEISSIDPTLFTRQAYPNLNELITTEDSANSSDTDDTDTDSNASSN